MQLLSDVTSRGDCPQGPSPALQTCELLMQISCYLRCTDTTTLCHGALALFAAPRGTWRHLASGATCLVASVAVRCVRCRTGEFVCVSGGGGVGSKSFKSVRVRCVRKKMGFLLVLFSEERC